MCALQGGAGTPGYRWAMLPAHLLLKLMIKTVPDLRVTVTGKNLTSVRLQGTPRSSYISLHMYYILQKLENIPSLWRIPHITGVDSPGLEAGCVSSSVYLAPSKPNIRSLNHLFLRKHIPEM